MHFCWLFVLENTRVILIYAPVTAPPAGPIEWLEGGMDGCMTE